jgi:ATP-binding cassette, subfamily B (MDR/TAP), member 1
MTFEKVQVPKVQSIEMESRPAPSYKGLFRFSQKSDFAILFPAIIASIANGILVPAFSILMGRIFTAFGAFSSGEISSQDLEKQVTLYVVAICVVGVAAWGIGWAHLALWLAFGENNAKRAREQVMKGLLQKSMTWYDVKVTDAGVSGNMNKAVKYYSGTTLLTQTH